MLGNQYWILEFRFCIFYLCIQENRHVTGAGIQIPEPAGHGLYKLTWYYLCVRFTAVENSTVWCALDNGYLCTDVLGGVSCPLCGIKWQNGG